MKIGLELGTHILRAVAATRTLNGWRVTRTAERPAPAEWKRDPRELLPVLRALREEVGGGREPVTVGLPEDLVLVKSFSAPKNGASTAAIRALVDRWCPFPLDQAVWDLRPPFIAVASRSFITALTETVEQTGWRVSTIDSRVSRTASLFPGGTGGAILAQSCCTTVGVAREGRWKDLRTVWTPNSAGTSSEAATLFGLKSVETAVRLAQQDTGCSGPWWVGGERAHEIFRPESLEKQLGQAVKPWELPLNIEQNSMKGTFSGVWLSALGAAIG